jgi:hypothetical protein
MLVVGVVAVPLQRASVRDKRMVARDTAYFFVLSQSTPTPSVLSQSTPTPSAPASLTSTSGGRAALPSSSFTGAGAGGAPFSCAAATLAAFRFSLHTPSENLRVGGGKGWASAWAHARAWSHRSLSRSAHLFRWFLLSLPPLAAFPFAAADASTILSQPLPSSTICTNAPCAPARGSIVGGTAACVSDDDERRWWWWGGPRGQT